MKRRWSVGIFLLIAVFALFGSTVGPSSAAEGIVSVDTYNPAELNRLIRAGYSSSISWADAYSNFVDVPAYIPNVGVEQAWAYIQDIFALQEWTMSVRNVKPMPDFSGRKRHSADDLLSPGGKIYFLEKKDAASYTVDWWVGHSPEDIWMRYCMRVSDAKPIVGKPGVLLTWVNFGHDNFNRDPILLQGFLMMKIAHGIERDNMVKILQYRARGNTGPLDINVMRQLGLINVELYEPMQLWGMIASGLRPSVPWNEHYGEFIGSHFFIRGVSAEVVWKFLQVPHHLNMWTMSLRNLRMKSATAFEAIDKLPPFGQLQGEIAVHPGSWTIDYRMAPMGHGRPGEEPLWMNSMMRVMDGVDTNGMPGAVVVWIHYRHVNYEQNPLFAEYWRYLPVRNNYSAQNLSKMLQSLK